MVEEMRTWFAWQGVPTLDVEIAVRKEQVDQPAEPPEAPELPGELKPPEAEIPETPGRLSLKSSHANRQQGIDNLQQAIDGNPYTRWSTQQPQQPGMWLQIDLGEVRTVSQVRLDNEQSPADYPRGYVVKVSQNGRDWTTVAQNPLNDRPLNVTFSPREVRLIYIEQTGSDPGYWWSIHSIEVSSEVKMSAQASHNNIWVGADNLAQALDGRPETRWSSRSLQAPGMWFELDLHETRTVSGLALDTAGSPDDYPRGYVVRLSTDGEGWVEVARQAQNDRALEVSFSPQATRYIRIEQTGRASDWWWSIHGVTIVD
jgi:hypothetical protein